MYMLTHLFGTASSSLGSEPNGPPLLRIKTLASVRAEAGELLRLAKLYWRFNVKYRLVWIHIQTNTHTHTHNVHHTYEQDPPSYEHVSPEDGLRVLTTLTCREVMVASTRPRAARCTSITVSRWEVTPSSQRSSPRRAAHTCV